MASTRIIHVTVLADTCVRAGLCVETCPQVFEFPPPTPDQPSPAVRVRDDASQHYLPLDDAIRQAARDCPVHAILVEQ
jgi:ferredoxin